MTNLVLALACALGLPLSAHSVSVAVLDADGILRRGDTGSAIRSLSQASDQLGEIPEKPESIPLLRGIADKFKSLGARSSAMPVLPRRISIAEKVDPDSVNSLLTEFGNTEGEIEDHAAAKITFETLLSKISPENSLGRATVYIRLLKAAVRDQTTPLKSRVW